VGLLEEASELRGGDVARDRGDPHPGENFPQGSEHQRAARNRAVTRVENGGEGEKDTHRLVELGIAAAEGDTVSKTIEWPSKKYCSCREEKKMLQFLREENPFAEGKRK